MITDKITLPFKLQLSFFNDLLLEIQVLIQLGDVLDRGEDEIAILSLLRSLDIQARAQGGAVFQVCNVKKWNKLLSSKQTSILVLCYCQIM